MSEARRSNRGLTRLLVQAGDGIESQTQLSWVAMADHWLIRADVNA